MRAVLLLLAACSTSSMTPGFDACPATPEASIEDSPSSMDVTDAASMETSMSDAGCATGYPSGPYGTKVGDIIDNIQFTGIRDANMNGTFSDDMPIAICLGAFRLDPNIKAIAIISSAVWCGPCNQEEPTR